MIFTSVDLPAPFSPSNAWVSVPWISRSMPSLAANAPNRLVMCTADSNGSRAGCGGVGSSMRATGWDERRAIRNGFIRRNGVAADQELRRDGGRNGGRRLVANFGEADRADQTLDIVATQADLAQRAGKARALGGTADQAHIGKSARQQGRGRDVEIEGVTVRHDCDERAVRRLVEQLHRLGAGAAGHVAGYMRGKRARA